MHPTLMNTELAVYGNCETGSGRSKAELNAVMFPDR
jgi:hypothetical protein